MPLELIKQKIVEIGSDRLSCLMLRRLRSRVIIEIPVQIADEIRRFLGRMFGDRDGLLNDGLLNHGGFIGHDRRCPCAHGAEQCIQLVFKAAFARNRGLHGLHDRRNRDRDGRLDGRGTAWTSSASSSSTIETDGSAG